MKSVFKKIHAKHIKNLNEKMAKVAKQFKKLEVAFVLLNDNSETVKEEQVNKKKGRKKKSSSDE